MKERNWTSKHSAKQSNRINATKPWERSTGPTTAVGKNQSKMNALTHGFYTANLRNFRKSERRKEFREFENQCKDLQRLVKAGDTVKIESAVEVLERKFAALNSEYDQMNLTSELSQEALQASHIMLKTMTYAIQKGSMDIISKLVSG